MHCGDQRRLYLRFILVLFLCMRTSAIVRHTRQVLPSRFKAARAMSTKSLSISSIFERKTAPNTVLVISGATSVGKSSVALDLCQLIGGEIISSDSVQVYSQLDVGSNKATAAEMALVPHHLIDIAEPSTTLTTGDFSRRAAAAIDDILSRGKVPVLVGGATMWIQWLVQGIPDAPKAKPKAQQRASELLKDIEPARRWDDAMALLEQYDPARAAKLSRNDWYRMRRSLEIAVQIVEFDNVASSRPPSPAGSPLLDGKRKSVLGSREVDLRTVFINEDRSLLYHTIDSRCVDMLRLGHISEVGDLLYREVLRPEYPVSKAIGYRQTIEYLARGADHEGGGPSAMRKIYLEEDMVAFLEYLKSFCTATRNYAKRQLNWYRKDNSFLFLNVNRTSVGKKEAYRKVAEEVWHWATVPRSEFEETLHFQVAVNNALASLRSKPRIPDDYMPDTPEKRLALAYVLYKKEIWCPGQGKSGRDEAGALDEENERKRAQKKADRANRKAAWEAKQAQGDSVTEPTSVAAAASSVNSVTTVPAATPAPSAAPAWMQIIHDPALGVTPESLESFKPEWSAQSVDLRSSGENNKTQTNLFQSRVLERPHHVSYLGLIAEADKWRRRLHADKRELLCRFLEEWSAGGASGDDHEGKGSA